MPKHRRRKAMLDVICIVLFVVFLAQLPAFSVSVAAKENGALIAEEYERYHVRFEKIEKISQLRGGAKVK